MPTPSFISEKVRKLPVLIIDHEGSIGVGVYAKLRHFLQVVLVAGQEPEEKENLLFLHFGKHIPLLPEDQYSHIFLVAEQQRKDEEILDQCAKKAKEDNARLIIVVRREKLTSEKIVSLVSLYSKTTIVVIGEFIDNPFVKAPSVMQHFFTLAKKRQVISLPDTGLLPLFPIAYGDFLSQLVTLGFDTKDPRGIFLYYPSFPITELGVVHAMQRVDPVIKVDFTKEKNENMHQDMIEGQFLLPPDYPIFKKIEEAYRNFTLKEHINEPMYPVSPPTVYSKKKVSYERTSFKKNFVVFLLLLFLLPWFLFSVEALTSGGLLILSKNALEKGSPEQATQEAFFAKKSIEVSSYGFLLVKPELFLMRQSTLRSSSEEMISALHALAFDMENVSNSLEKIQKVFVGHSQSPQIDFIGAIAIAKKTQEDMQRLSQNDFAPKELQTIMQKNHVLFSLFSRVADVLPDIFGFPTAKTYLVLFQNNMELRPGGGFIGSYALVKVEKGRVVNVRIHDVYDADGQLRGHIEPPFAIRRYMGIVHLYLRDSNFSVDFPQDATAAVQMLYQETGQKVDGVIGIDLSLVQKLLVATGPVYVPEYQETVTSENIFSLAETHAEKNFFPGSTQKKDFLRSLFGALQAKLQTGEVSYSKLVDQVSNALMQKDIVFAFDQNSLQNVFTVSGFSSSLCDPRQNGQGVINDFLGINEANIGVNKVNYFVHRTLTQAVRLTPDGHIQETVTLHVQNMSKKVEWPGGIYKNFLRFIIPQDAIVTGIAINTKPQVIVPAITDPVLYEKKDFIPPSGLEVQKEILGSKQTVGFLVNIPEASESIISLSYTLGQQVFFGPSLTTYNLVLFKQIGVGEYPYTFSLSLPNNLSFITKPAEFMQIGDEVVGKSTIVQDTDLNFQMASK